MNCTSVSSGHRFHHESRSIYNHTFLVLERSNIFIIFAFQTVTYIIHILLFQRLRCVTVICFQKKVKIRCIEFQAFIGQFISVTRPLCSPCLIPSMVQEDLHKVVTKTPKSSDVLVRIMSRTRADPRNKVNLWFNKDLTKKLTTSAF